MFSESQGNTVEAMINHLGNVKGISLYVVGKGGELQQDFVGFSTLILSLSNSQCQGNAGHRHYSSCNVDGSPRLVVPDIFSMRPVEFA